MPNHLRPRRLLPADAKSLQHPPAALLATAHNAVALQQADLRQPKPDPKLQIAAALERSVAALAKLAALGLSPARPCPMRWGRASTRRLPPPYDAPSSAKGQCQTQGRCTPDRIGRQPPWPKRATPDGGRNIGGHGRTTSVPHRSRASPTCLREAHRRRAWGGKPHSASDDGDQIVDCPSGSAMQPSGRRSRCRRQSKRSYETI